MRKAARSHLNLRFPVNASSHCAPATFKRLQAPVRSPKVQADLIERVD